MRICAVCRKKSTLEHAIYSLPSTAQQLGLDSEWAHPDCAIRFRHKLERFARKMGVSLQEIVENGQR